MGEAMVAGAVSTYEPGAPLPAHASIDAVIAEALPALMPPRRISVSAAAERRQVEAGGYWIPWRNGVAPYMVEPQDMIGSRRFDSVVFVGPARSAKTEALIKNALAHAILAAPRLVHVLHMGRNEAREFSIAEIAPMIRHSPELAARMGRGKGADNVFDKRFSGGGRLTVGWPVVSQLSGRSIPLVLITDYDRIADDIDGEGSAFALGRKRTTAHQSRGMTVVESSPGRPILDEAWRPETAHEAPPCTGILALYNAGTRGRWYWQCRDCGGDFEPGIDRLETPEEGTPAARGAATVMVCPHCGSVIRHREKAAFNALGKWLHEGPSGVPVPMGEAVRATDTASYWLPGPAAAFASWATITARRLEAEATFDATGDESSLKSVVNVDFGLPYLPRARDASAGLSEAGLREAATDHAWRVAPRGTRFLTGAVDVQRGRFVVQVEAWSADLERTLIDRFDIHTPPEGAPRAGERVIDPGRFAEDWESLVGIIGTAYPVATEDRALHPVAVIFDSRGEPGVTANAYAFFRRMRRTHPRRFWPVQGVPGDRAKRAEIVTPESAHRGRRHAARDIRIVKAGGDRLKDEVAASLLRTEDGARALHIPRGAPAEVFAEYAAERRGEKGWEKKPGQRRNEALDLSVYALALVVAVLGAERIADWNAPPPWADADPVRNPFTARSAETEAETAPPMAATMARRPAHQRRPRRRFDGW